METDQFYQSFFENTYTQVDARRRLNILETALEDSLFGSQTGKPLEQVLQQKEMSEVDKESLMKFIKTAALPKDHTAIKKLMTGLKDAIISRPVITLTVSFEPNAEQIIAYGQWFRANINGQVLMSIVFSAAVVGGCSVSWQGKEVTYDLEYLIKKKRNEIVAVVNSFVEKKKKEVVI